MPVEDLTFQHIADALRSVRAMIEEGRKDPTRLDEAIDYVDRIIPALPDSQVAIGPIGTGPRPIFGRENCRSRTG